MWQLAVDIGSRAVKAARLLDGLAEPVTLAGRPDGPAAVYRDRDGSLRSGWEAIDRGAVHPDRLEETPRRWLANGSTLVLAGRVLPVSDVLAELVSATVDHASAAVGSAPDRLLLTHPAGWSTERLALLVEASRSAGWDEVVLIAEPIAAAVGVMGPIEPGRAVAVMDLGAGSLGCSVVGAGPAGPALLGPPGGHERMGGDVFDQRLSHLVDRRLAASEPALRDGLERGTEVRWERARMSLRMQVRRAREQLSYRSVAQVAVPVNGRSLHVSREELDGLIGADVERCVAALEQTVAAAGLVTAQLDRVLLVGGASRTPLLQMAMLARFGDLVVADEDPAGIVALGAARMAGGVVAPVERRSAPTIDEAAALAMAEGAAAASSTAAEPTARRVGTLSGGGSADVPRPGGPTWWGELGAPSGTAADGTSATASGAGTAADMGGRPPLLSASVVDGGMGRPGSAGSEAPRGVPRTTVVLVALAVVVAAAIGAGLMWLALGGSDGTTGRGMGAAALGVEGGDDPAEGSPGEVVPPPTDAVPPPVIEVPPPAPDLVDDYPAEVQANFFEACLEAGGRPDRCACVWEGVVEELPFEVFLQIEEHLVAGIPASATPVGAIVDRCNDEWP
ncbi:MAG: Hsp70 family protein [Acidimicrobiia bacterium]|nr:Hsp70 family protein [Acidimicrobiia bacterium]